MSTTCSKCGVEYIPKFFEEHCQSSDIELRVSIKAEKKQRARRKQLGRKKYKCRADCPNTDICEHGYCPPHQYSYCHCNRKA